MSRMPVEQAWGPVFIEMAHCLGETLLRAKEEF